MSDISHKAHQFRIRYIFGLPFVVERYAVPSQYGSPGSFEWSRWRFVKFWNSAVLQSLLMDLDRG